MWRLFTKMCICQKVSRFVTTKICVYPKHEIRLIKRAPNISWRYVANNFETFLCFFYVHFVIVIFVTPKLHLHCDTAHESTERREHLNLIRVIPLEIERLPSKAWFAWNLYGIIMVNCPILLCLVDVVMCQPHSMNHYPKTEYWTTQSVVGSFVLY